MQWFESTPRYQIQKPLPEAFTLSIEDTMIHLYDSNNYLRKRYEVDNSGLAMRNLFNEAYHVPDPMIFVFDGKDAKAHRRKLYPDYKGNRKPAPDSFYVTMGIFKELVMHTGKTILEIPGHEADDIIATLVRTTPNTRISIHSNDFDYAPLLNEFVTMTEKSKKEVEVSEVRLYKTLVGDPSDNIKGIKGFGKDSWPKLTPEQKALWAGLFDANKWRSEPYHVDIPDASLLGITDKIRGWVCENFRILQAYWSIVNFVPVDNDLMMKHMKVGTPNYALADSILKEIFQ